MQLITNFADAIRNTGERPVIRTMFEDIHPVLRFSYEFVAQKLTGNEQVLDYGCGGGYGTEYLSRFTSGRVIGFDIDPKTIAITKDYYKGKQDLAYTADSNTLGKYDVVVSFQVIEHLSPAVQEQYLAGLKRHLKPEGTYFLATVNKNISSYKLKRPIMPFHVHEFYPDELEQLLKQYFPRVNGYGQIDKQVAGQVDAGTWHFSREYNKEFRQKIIRAISQCELVRIIARHIPLSLKGMVFGYQINAPESYKERYVLAGNREQFANSYILIYECKN